MAISTADGLIAAMATAQLAELYKVGTTPEAAGSFYCFSKDSGFPGAWVPGTPGLAGRATDGTQSADAGSIPFTNPSVGNTKYLAAFSMAATAACQLQIYDFLWVNSGIAITTTTAQAVNSVPLPARDSSGAVNGMGVGAGVLVVASTTNVGAIANMTISYTNSLGVTGRTATIASFPATATVGTFVPFQLQSGDTGVKSIQSVTLGTSLVSGSVSLIMYRKLASLGIGTANIGFGKDWQSLGMPILYPGSNLHLIGLASTAASFNLCGDVTLIEG